MIRKRHAGSSLVELLVVIVIFLIGILGVIQVFPAGFLAMTTTRNNSIATELARMEIERLKGRSDRLPVMILPIRYVQGMTGISMLADADRDNRNLGPAGVAIDQNGMVLDASNTILGPWGQLSGANVMRRVIDEGGRVPPPRNVGGVIGGLMVLQFGPIVFNPTYEAFLRVYGNDMVRRWGQPGPGSVNRIYDFWVSEEDDNGNSIDTLYLPIIPLPVAANESPYRISLSYYVDTGASNRLDEVIDLDPQVIRNNLVVSTAYPGFWTLDIQDTLSDAGLLAGVTYLTVDGESTHVQKTYQRIAGPFTNNPYEYQLLDANLGVLLFNPVGFDYYERRPNGQRVPLLARVNYDVLDWRIIRQEFRTPVAEPWQFKLTLNTMLIKGQTGPDGQRYNGLGFQVPVTSTPASDEVDVLLVDSDTGGVYATDVTNPRDPLIPPTTSNDYMAIDPTRSSYYVDKSLGMVRLLDFDRNSANGLQMRMFYPGQTTPVVVDADRRKMLVLYRARNEWAVQVLKSPSNFQIVYDRPGVAQCYVGTSSVYGGFATRIYFPGSDNGKKVTIGEIWYTNPGGLQVMRDQDFIIGSTPSDPLGLPYVDIRTVDASAIGFDFSNQYAVRTVKGASVTARVLWNPANFRLTNDPVANMEAFDVWGRNWRRTTVENYLERGEN